MDRRQLLRGIVPVTTMALVGCTGDDNGTDGENGTTTTSTTTTSTTTTTEEPGTTTTEATVDLTVDLVNTTFNPVVATADVGATVRWVNEDSFGHDVTSAEFSNEGASWEFSESLAGGESTTYTFDSEGAFEYYCTIHGLNTMCGVVVVGDISYNGGPPCQGDDDGDGGGY